MWYNIFCCIKGKEGNGESSSAKNYHFLQDAATFNSDRDIIKIVSKLNVMEFKVNMMEEIAAQVQTMTMENEQAKRDAGGATKVVHGEVPRVKGMSQNEVMNQANSNIKQVQNVGRNVGKIGMYLLVAQIQLYFLITFYSNK